MPRISILLAAMVALAACTNSPAGTDPGQDHAAASGAAGTGAQDQRPDPRRDDSDGNDDGGGGGY